MSLGQGDQLGDYRIVSRLGAGAYGEVFEAEHIITRRRDAIKVLSDSRLRIPEEEERFLREIRVQASLHHPNIATVYHAFWTPHGLALVMELAPGEPLSAVLSHGRIPLPRGLRLAMEMLSGLAYAHGQKVVHRDIKPENIIVASDSSVKLTDFGLARSVASPRITQSGAAAGSPCYMSPEQAVGTATVDSRSDTYSAGVVLYEMATGRLPFMGDTAFAVMLAHQNATPKPPIEIEPCIGPELNQVILRALEKDPDRRYQNASEFQAALEAVFAPPGAKVAAQAVRPIRGRLLVAAAVCSLAILAAAYSFSHRTHKWDIFVHNQIVPAVTSVTSLIERASPVAEQKSPDPAVVPERPPRTQATRPVKRVAAAPQKLRITGSTRDVPVLPPPPPPEPRAERAQPKSSTALVITSTPVVAPPMPVPETKAAPAAVEDEPKPTPVKKRNAVVRAFQHVFGKRQPTTPAPADGQEQRAVPRH